MVLNAQATCQLLDQYVVYTPRVSGSAQLCHAHERQDEDPACRQGTALTPAQELPNTCKVVGQKRPERSKAPRALTSGLKHLVKKGHMAKGIQILLTQMNELRAVQMP